jgi:arylsulfatase A-like enzyme
MVAHDKLISQVLDYLDELGIADNTFVMYSTDNGFHRNTWPDAGIPVIFKRGSGPCGGARPIRRWRQSMRVEISSGARRLLSAAGY